MVNNIHNTRILRFLIVIAAVVLTIFIYASYSTSPQMAPAHMHTHMSMSPEALQQQHEQHQLYVNNKSGELSATGVVSSAGVSSGSDVYENNLNNQGKFSTDGLSKSIPSNKNHHVHQFAKMNKKSVHNGGPNSIESSPSKKHHRQPTVDIEAGGADIPPPNTNSLDDGPADEAALDRLGSNYFLDEQDLSNPESPVGNVNNSASSPTGDGASNKGKSVQQKNLSKEQQQLQQQQQQDLQQQEQKQKLLENDKRKGDDDNNDNNKNDNSKSANANKNKVLESDVLIPTSNLQKFIENADKILKNMTAAGATSNSVPPQQNQQDDKQNSPQEKKEADSKKATNEEKNENPNKDDDEEFVPEEYDDLQQPSNIMTIKSASKIEEEKKQQQEQQQQKEEEPNHREETAINLEEKQKYQVVNIAKNTLSAGVEGLEGAQIPSQATAGSGPVLSQSKALNPEIKVVESKSQTISAVSSQNAKKVIVNVKNSTSTTTSKVLDPSQGIPTQQIYESGHLNEELNIEKLCPNGGADLKLLILITSAQSHSEARLSIRQTWGHYGSRRDVSIAFVLGRSANQTLNLALSQENFIYGDLIRGNFIDSYNNLTLKTISALEWVDQHCSRAKFILKTDDDMFINVPKLLSFLDNHSKDKRTIYGRLAKKWKPIRNKKSKYYVSSTQFSASIFPSFTTGPAYVLTSDIVHDLYERSLQQVYFKLEDVFTTGIVAQQLGIKRVHVNEFLNRRIAFNACNIRKTISVHMIKANEQFDLWKKLLDQTTKCK